MAWTTPVTWVDTTVYDDADFDAQIKDNLNFLYSPPSCLTQSNADRNLANNTTTNLLMQVERWDTDSMHPTGQYYHDINTPGTFLMLGQGAFSLADVDGIRSIQLNISEVVRMTVPGVAVVTFTALQVAHTRLMANTDFVRLEGYQNSGSTLPVLAGTAWLLSHWCGNP